MASLPARVPDFAVGEPKNYSVLELYHKPLMMDESSKWRGACPENARAISTRNGASGASASSL